MFLLNNMGNNEQIKLDKIDRKILFELDKNCRISTIKLAKLVRKSRQAVEYRINHLAQKGIITGFQTAINPHKLGYKLYKFYLKLRNVPEEKEKLLAYLKNSGIVYWMGECSGSWDLIFAIFARDDYELFDFKNDLISKFHKILIEEEGQNLLDVKQFSKRYLTDSLVDPVMFGGDVVNNELDKIDYLILEKIVNNARISLVELASKLKSSALIIKRRLKKMEEKGIIIQYRIGIDLKKLGLELYKAVIRIDRYNVEDQKKLLQFFSSLSQIQYFIKNLWTIEPELVVKDYNEYYSVIEDLKKQFPNVIRTVDFVLMRTDEWTPGFKNLFKGK